tara:strand:+ start:467 stop:1135 length:669 start_codon:yes stop_codon:yes gene_type:complete
MHSSLEKLTLVKNKVNEIINKKNLNVIPKIIVVTKTFPLNIVSPLIQSGHIHFGENKLQEAEKKWIELKETNKNIQLHMIGKLQSNKAKKAVKLFDYIHSLDNEKLAFKINQYQKELNKKCKLFIEVNLANESQKGGITEKNLGNFYDYCVKDLSLNIVGLMCLPPINSNSSDYFKLLKNNSEKLNLKDLSMGMSSDYEQAVLHGSTYLRIGTAILGERTII